jgi:hypothetical protein
MVSPKEVGLERKSLLMSTLQTRIYWNRSSAVLPSDFLEGRPSLYNARMQGASSQ